MEGRVFTRGIDDGMVIRGGLENQEPDFLILLNLPAQQLRLSKNISHNLPNG